jgi:hypothetical protein
VEHRVPTPGTVKVLYGTAFSCGKPGCGADLYVMDERNGRRGLNSRDAHIHAHSEGGPHWNAGMSEDDNRDASMHAFVAIRYSQVRTVDRPSNAAKFFHARRNVSCTSFRPQ